MRQWQREAATDAGYLVTFGEEKYCPRERYFRTMEKDFFRGDTIKTLKNG
jgi:hypothetical protein